MNSASLFIYWHVSPGQAAEAAEAVRSFHAQVCKQHAGLRAHLLRRQDGDGSRVTLMETYSSSKDLPQELASEADAALAQWALSGRQVEVFEPAD